MDWLFVMILLGHLVGSGQTVLAEMPLSAVRTSTSVMVGDAIVPTVDVDQIKITHYIKPLVKSGIIIIMP